MSGGAAELLQRRWRDAAPWLDALLEQPPGTRERWLQAQGMDPELQQLLQRVAHDAERSQRLDAPLLLPDLSRSDAAWTRRLGPWRLRRPLGAGGAASVFLGARDDGVFEQTVAIKILRHGVLDPLERARFARERQLLAQLEHPGIARLIDGGLTPEGAPYLVLEYVDGAPILGWCDAARLDLRARLRLFLRACEAVQYAHQHLIVHRDLKPSNLLVDARGQVKLLDFGIAKLLDDDATATGTEARRLTPAYAAPEQLRGEAVSTAVDVYALGVVLHELLCGERPQGGAQGRGAALAARAARAPAAVAAARGAHSARALARALGGDLQGVLDGALQFDPLLRYPTVAALAQDVEAWLDGRAPAYRGEPGWRRALRWTRRHALALGVAALLACVLLGAAGFALRQAQLARAEADRAEDVQAFLVELLQRGAVDGERTAPLTVDDLLRAGATQARAAFPDSPQTRASLLTTLGRLLHGQGRLEEAREALRAAQRTERDALGLVPHGSLRTRWALALLRAELEPGPATRAELEGVLREQRAAAAATADIAESLLRLGAMESRAGEHASALPKLEQAVASSAPGAARGAAQLMLGDAQARAGDDTAARRSFDAAMAEVPPRSIEYSRVQRSLGYLLQRAGDWPGAQDALEESLALQVTLLPTAHPHIADTLIALGALTFDRGRFAQSRDYFARALQMREQRFGRDAVESVETLIGLGSATLQLGDARGAAALMQDARRRLATQAHATDSTRAWVLGNLSAALRKSGDPDAALQAAEQGHALSLREHGIAHSATVAARISVERARFELGRQEEALRSLRAARAAIDDARRGAPLDLLLGHLLLERREFAAARGAFEAVRAALPPEARGTLRADAEVGLADAAQGRGDAARARSHLQEAHRLLAQRLPADHPRLAALRQRVR